MPSPAAPRPAPPAPISLGHEVVQFETTADKIAIGDLQIRKNFATRVMFLFAIANVSVLIGLYVVFRQDGAQLAAHLVKPTERIIDGKVVMALLGATTIQLGTVIYTITRAIFPSVAGAQN